MGQPECGNTWEERDECVVLKEEELTDVYSPWKEEKYIAKFAPVWIIHFYWITTTGEKGNSVFCVWPTHRSCLNSFNRRKRNIIPSIFWRETDKKLKKTSTRHLFTTRNTVELYNWYVEWWCLMEVVNDDDDDDDFGWHSLHKCTTEWVVVILAECDHNNYTDDNNNHYL